MSNPFQLLIVEDESTVCNFLNDILGHEGYSILTAANGHEALEHINLSTIDLILLDIGLPDMDGYQIMEHIDSQRLDLLVIVMTGEASAKSAVTAMRKGAYDYLRKPLEKVELLTTIKNAFNYKKEESVRRELEEKLKQHNKVLEQMVAKRTIELKKTNEKLQQELIKRKKNQDALKESEKRFRETAELLPQTIFEIDLDGNLIFVNRTAFDYFGYTQQDIKDGVNSLNMIAEGDRDKAVVNIGKILAGEKIGMNEYTALRKDGSTFPAMIHSTPILRKSKPIGLRGIIIDITERKRMEQILRNAHDELELMVKVRTAEFQLINKQLEQEIAERVQLEEELLKSKKLLRIQRDLGVALSSVSNLQDALTLALKSAFQVKEISCGGVYLVDDATGELKLAHHEGLSPAFLQTASYYSPDTPQAKLVMAGKSVFNDYYTQLKKMNIKADDDRRQLGLRAVGIIPVKYDARIIAALNVGSYTHDLISAESRDTLEGIATQIGGAIIRLKADQALKEKQVNLQTLFEQIEDFLFILDSEGNVVHCNPVVQKRLGYSAEEIAQMNVLNFHPEDRHEEAAAIVADMIAGKSSLCDIPLITKDGSLIPVETRVTKGKWNNQDVLFGVARDLTDRNRWEEALRESEERFRNLVENSLIGISIIQENQFLYQNPEQLKMYTPLSGTSIWQDFENVHPDDLEKVKAAYQNILSGEVKSVETDFRFYPPGNVGSPAEMRWVQCKGTSFQYHGKDAILINAIDITKAKQLEQQLLIKNKMLSLGRIAAGIAHEIRNPLTGINSYLYTLDDLCHQENLKHEDLQMMRKIVDQIQVASNKIESVIRRVMDFSKPGVPKMVLTDINASLNEAIQLSEVTLRKSGIKLEKSLAPSLPPCYADPQLIEQVILNLVTNSAKAMQQANGSKLIEIKSFSKNNSLFILVSDSGPGVPLKLRETIFDPFFTTKDDGSGIGLNIAQRIVADHNGSISLNTSQWGGAEFIVELPIERRMNPR